MVFWKELDTSNTNIMRPYAEAIAMIMHRERMPATGAYNTLKSTPSIMDDPYAHVLEYNSDWLSISVVFNLKDIMGLSIFMSVSSDEPKNGAPKVVDIAIFS